MKYTSVKIRSDIKERLSNLARAKGISLSSLIVLLYEAYRDENRLTNLLKEILDEVRRQNRILEEIYTKIEDIAYTRSMHIGDSEVKVRIESPGEVKLPSFVRDNPWLEVLKELRR